MASRVHIGLDIGSTAIRAVESGRGKDGLTITNCGHAQLPSGAVRSGVIHDEETVTAGLRQLWSDSRLRGRNVTLGVANPQIVVREISVPNLPERKLRAALPFQVRDALPIPVERAVLDFYPLEPSDTAETVRGLLIAAPKDAVLAAVRVVERAGLRVGRVDLASFALLRATAQLDGEVEAIVDIGARSTNEIVHADGVPLIARTIPRGGADITDTIAEELNLSAADAETAKCRTGLSHDREPAPAPAAVAREAIRPLINELRSSFTYLTAGDRQSRVSRMVLSGGGSLLAGLAEELTVQLDLEVVGANPLQRFRAVRRGRQELLEQFLPAAAVPVGLTLGAA